MDIHKMRIISTIRKKLNLSNNFIRHLQSLHGTQHKRKLTLWSEQVLSLTQHCQPLPWCSPGAFDILYITIWVLRACIVFIQRLAFKNGDPIFGCRSLKIHFGHQNSHHSTQVPILLQTKYLHYCCGRPSYRGDFMHCDIGLGKRFNGT